MSTPAWRISRVEERSREILGDRAKAWMKAPNRTLSHLSPHELAETSDAGMRVVLTELERNEVVLRHMTKSGMRWSCAT
jgi:uncharacterized protein (DUF2384 family)